MAVYEFDELVMTFEMTLYTPYMILADQALRDGDIFPHWPQNASRIEIFGTKGLMVVGRHGMGWQVFGRPHQRKPVVDRPDVRPLVRRGAPRRLPATPSAHGRRPNADIHEGHLSTLLPQYANISYRLGGEKLLSRSRDRDLHQQRGRQRAPETRVPQALGRARGSLNPPTAETRAP